MHCGYVIKVENLRPHSNADRLQVLTVFGNDTCVGLDVKVGDIGIYFPTDLQLSVEYANANNLVRKKDDAGNNIGGYMEASKRNVKTIRLRGEISDGIYMPLDSLAFTGVDLNTLTVGTTIDVVNGVEICKKYIPRRTNRNGAAAGQGNRTRKKKTPVAPLFAEHADTEQLAYNLSAFRPGDEIEITLKMHGTSQRTGYLPVLQGYTDSFGCRAGNAIRHLLNKMGKYHGEDEHDGEPIYEYGYVSGTRRTVLENYEGGFYGDNHFREQHSKIFEGKLEKGETVYYEIVSFTDNGTPIMGKAKVPKEYQNQYGKEMLFHYGLDQGSDIYVYRMTMTNEDGFVVEYTPDFMRYRCEQMGVKTVPVMDKFIIPTHKPLGMWNDEDKANDTPGYRPPIDAGEYVKRMAEYYYDGPDPIGKTHTREGVVVRILNRPKFCAYKHKNFLFKLISGIIKEQDIITNISEDILSEM